MLLIIILAVLLLIPVLTIILGYIFSTKPYKGPDSDHFKDGRFVNPGGVQVKGFKEVFKFLRSRDPQPWQQNYETYQRTEPIDDYNGKGLRFYFVNHSTFLLQMGGLNILTDPIWSERCSPVSWSGPKRLRPPGVAMEALPRIDLILQTHNHYDHLDVASLKKINAMHNPAVATTLGVGNFLQSRGLENITEMDWNQSRQVGNLRITVLPAIHFSGRGTFDRNKSLWCGFMLETSDFRCYYSGDTGYGDGAIFREIGSRFPEIDLSFIPIGAYMPRWFMSPIHISPVEAVQLHQDVNSRQSVAMHFGTFPLADEGPGQAERELAESLEKSGIPQEEFIAPAEGMPYTFLRTQESVPEAD